MKKSTKSTKAAAKKRKVVSKEIEYTPEPVMDTSMNMPVASSRPKWPFAVAIVVVVLVVLYFVKNQIIAATVNGSPITSWELNAKLRERYGESILDTMVAEKLINDEAAKQGISVSNDEVETKIKSIEATLQGGMKLADALKLQGVTEGEFRSQVKTQALIDKLLSKEASVSSSEVDAYIASNAAYLTATEPAKQREEAEAALKNSKLGDAFNKWFTDLRAKADIKKFF